MRTPTAFDAVARWIAASLAGCVLLAIVPPGTVRWPAEAFGPLEVVHLTAVVILVAAWLQFVAHVALAHRTWSGDPLSIVLVCASAVASAACIVTAVSNTWQALGVAVGFAVVVQVALALRIDARKRASAAEAASTAPAL